MRKASETKPATELGDANQGAFVDRSSILRASTNSYKQVGKRIYLLFITYRYRGESNSMQGAGVKKTRERF